MLWRGSHYPSMGMAKMFGTGSMLRIIAGQLTLLEERQRLGRFIILGRLRRRRIYT